MKVIQLLKKKGPFLKGTAPKIASQKQRFLIFLKPLITAGLPLMKNVLTLIAKSISYQKYNLIAKCQQQMQLFKMKYMNL